MKGVTMRCVDFDGGEVDPGDRMLQWDSFPLFCAGDGSQHDCAPEGQTLAKGKWYFWIETWADVTGPFDTEEEGRAALQKYSETL